MKTLRDKLMVRPGHTVKLAQYDPADTLGLEKDAATEETLGRAMARLDELQLLLYAENRRALLVVLQGMDAAGKDGTIRHVLSGLNPQGCRVNAFKAPVGEELSHDFLWRVHRAVPARGEIGVFNRSHYEDVLTARVHKLVPKRVWEERYAQINSFEELLIASAVIVVKFFLYISKDEQKRRLQERLHNPAKQWKISPADFEDRRLWDDYMAAYEDVLTRCSTALAPWFVIPADRKWFRNFAVSHILAETLDGLDMRLPKPSFDLSRLTLE